MIFSEFQCDRCTVEVVEYSEISGLLFSGVRKPWDKGRTNQFNLCTRCAIGFRRFMSGGEVD